MESSEDKISKIARAYAALMDQRVAIPKGFGERLTAALSGGDLPCKEEWLSFLNFEFYLHKAEVLNEMGYSISEEQADLIRQSDCFVEELTMHTIRDYVGWGVPTEEVIGAITEEMSKLGKEGCSGLVEVGSGSGFWAKTLESRLSPRGLAVRACEINRRGDTSRPRHFESAEVDMAQMLKECPGWAVLVVWPDVNDVGPRLIETMEAGQTLFVQGNVQVTGNLTFYKELDGWFDRTETMEGVSFSGGGKDTFTILRKRSAFNADNDGFFETKYRDGNPMLKCVNKFKSR